MSNATDSKSQSTDSPQAVKSQDLAEPHTTNATSSTDRLPSGQQPAQQDNGRDGDPIPVMRANVRCAIEYARDCGEDEADAAISECLQALIEMELPEGVQRLESTDAAFNKTLQTIKAQEFRAILAALQSQFTEAK